MIGNFEEYLEKASSATDIETLFNVYLETIKQHGYDKALFALMTDHCDIGQESGVGVIHNFPDDWMKYYFEHNFDKIDPVILYGAQHVSAYSWDEIPEKVTLSQKQTLCLNYGSESGLHNGVSTYLRGEKNQLAGISLASSEKMDATDDNKDLITAYSNHFYIKYRELLSLSAPDHKEENIILTDKEREILIWVCTGKSNGVIGEILSISDSTVDFHLRNIFKKMGVNSRILAVVKALTHGVIRL